jgi:hypothetical protein
MATGGRNVPVDAYKIFSKIIDKYKHVYMFSEEHGISYATLTQLFSGKTKSLRAETVVKKVSSKSSVAQENMRLIMEELGL